MTESGAKISPGRCYRYSLWRIWDEDKPLCMFIMLNPSTANENENDPTIRRCVGFAKSWGYGGILIGNLLAQRATNPNELWGPPDCFETLNEKYIKSMYKRIMRTKGMVIAAWGNHGKDYTESNRMKLKYPNMYHLGLTKSGQPRHPLYLKSSTKPELWEKK